MRLLKSRGRQRKTLNQLRDEIFSISVEQGYYGDEEDAQLGKSPEVMAKLNQACDGAFEDELAYSIIRVLDMCGYLGVDIEKCIRLRVKRKELR